MPALPPSAPSPAFRMPDAGNGMFSGLLGRWSGGDLPLGISDVDVRLENTIGDPSVAYIGETALPSGSERDLASHYYASQQLTDRFGGLPAALGGVAQEFLNRGAGGNVGSGVGGFSLDDLAANYAGIIGATPEQAARAGLFEHTEPLESWEGLGQGTISGNWDKIRALHEGSFPLVQKIKGLFTDSAPQDAGLSAGTIRSPFPPTNTTPTTRRMVRALQNPLKVDVPRPPGGGGLFAGLGGLLSGAAAAWGLGLPLGMMWPSKISEEQGIVPESGPLTPQQLFKMRNDAEEQRIIEGRLPVIPEVPEWNPQASIPPDFRVNERSLAALSPSVTYNPPPDPRIREAEEGREQFRKFHPSGDLYMQNLGFEQGTGPMASQVSQALADAAYGRPVQEELQAITQLGATNPILIDRYTTPGSEELQDIESQVDSFAAMSNVGNRFGEVPWAPQASVVPDISEILKTYVPPPAAAAHPAEVETFKAHPAEVERVAAPKKAVVPVKVIKANQKRAVSATEKALKAFEVHEEAKRSGSPAEISRTNLARVQAAIEKKEADARNRSTQRYHPFAFEDLRGGRR